MSPTQQQRSAAVRAYYYAMQRADEDAMRDIEELLISAPPHDKPEIGGKDVTR